MSTKIPSLNYVGLQKESPTKNKGLGVKWDDFSLPLMKRTKRRSSEALRGPLSVKSQPAVTTTSRELRTTNDGESVTTRDEPALSKKSDMWETNVMDGKNLHVRYMAHILNQIVQDGLKKSGLSIKRVAEKFEKAFERFDLYDDNFNSYLATDICEDGSVAGYISSDSSGANKSESDKYRGEDQEPASEP
ncbi:hypothetical protein BC332_03378 [Capsicum chinense]|nr:hypothetical protein BC332_03378 [Capsicum chinense]